MVISEMKIKAYAVLVKAKKYILDESERANSEQKIIPAEYVEYVALELVK